MKKITLLALLAMGISAAHAQTRYGITAGFLHSSTHVSYKDGSTAPSESMKKNFYPEWQAGIIADIQLTSRLYLQPQLQVTIKGKSKYINTDIDPSVRRVDTRFRNTSLELPVNLVYKYPLGKGKLIGGGGGYIARGLGGRSRVTYYFRDGHEMVYKYGLKFKSDVSQEDEAQYNGYSRPIDLGLNFVTGYELKNGLAFKLNYSLGLKDKTPTYTREVSTKSKDRYFAATVSYLINRKA